jgi:hypothetical protein
MRDKLKSALQVNIPSVVIQDVLAPNGTCAWTNVRGAM